MHMMRPAMVEAPPRPYLPPVMAVAAGMLLASAGVLEVGWQAYCARYGQSQTACAPWLSDIAAGTAWFLVGGLLLCAGGAFLARRFKRKASTSPACSTMRRIAYAGMLVGLGVVAGALVGFRASAGRLESTDRLLSYPVSACAFRIQGDARESSFGFRHTAGAYLEGTYIGEVELSFDAELASGTVVRAVGRSSARDADGWGRSGFMKGAVVEVKLVVVQSEEYRPGAIERLRSHVLSLINPAGNDARALVAGIVCGRTTELSNGEASDAFSLTGTSHLVAVSGSHLALVASLIQSIARGLNVSRRTRSVAILAFMAVYVVFTGAAASATRSFVMIACSMLGGMAGRRDHGVSGLAISAIMLLALDAGVAYDLGFQLSALSVLFIHVFGSYLRFNLQRLGVPRALSEMLALTLCAQWATLPVTIPVFGSCSLVAPFANIVLGPCMTALLVSGLLVSLVASVLPGLSALLGIPEALAHISIFGAQLCSSIPYASLPAVLDVGGIVGCYALAVAVYAAWLRIRARHVVLGCSAVLAILLGQALFWRFLAPPTVSVLDVGQADAILIRDGSSAVLVDAGVDDTVGTELVKEHVLHLDAVLITHWDTDHCGGLDAVLGTASVDALVVAEGAPDHMPDDLTSLPLPQLREVTCGDVFHVGKFTCEVLWPLETVDGLDNEDSLAVAVSYEEGSRSLSVLLTGDTEADEEERYAARVGNIDVLKLGHHGSSASVSDEVLDALAPELAIASAGEGNRYGHPSTECLALLADHGIPALCTKDVGTVTVAPAEDGISVRVERSP